MQVKVVDVKTTLARSGKCSRCGRPVQQNTVSDGVVPGMALNITLKIDTGDRIRYSKQTRLLCRPCSGFEGI